MAHIFDVLSTINGQLNILAKDYGGQGKARHLNCAPDFLAVAVNRAIDRFPGNVENQDNSITIEKPTLGSTGDPYSPVYIAIVDNIRLPIIDKVPIMVNFKEFHGPGTAYVVGVPKKLMTTVGPETAATMLRTIYLDILSMDPEMNYEASPSIITLHDDYRVDISTYDLTMMLVAIGCININLRNWFVTDNGISVDSSYTINAFPEFRNIDEIKDGLKRILDKHSKTVNELRDAVANGKLVRLFMYEDK